VIDARECVRLTKKAFGLIPKPLNFNYVWGDAIPELDRRAPEVRLINLETTVTINGKRYHVDAAPDTLLFWVFQSS